MSGRWAGTTCRAKSCFEARRLVAAASIYRWPFTICSINHSRTSVPGSNYGQVPESVCNDSGQALHVASCFTNDAGISVWNLAGGKSWTAKLLGDPALCCSKIREEAGELAATWEGSEGKERAASEAADLLYHSLVLLNTQASSSSTTRPRPGIFGTSRTKCR